MKSSARRGRARNLFTIRERIRGKRLRPLLAISRPPSHVRFHPEIPPALDFDQVRWIPFAQKADVQVVMPNRIDRCAGQHIETIHPERQRATHMLVQVPKHQQIRMQVVQPKHAVRACRFSSGASAAKFRAADPSLMSTSMPAASLSLPSASVKHSWSVVIPRSRTVAPFCRAIRAHVRRQAYRVFWPSRSSRAVADRRSALPGNSSPPRETSRRATATGVPPPSRRASRPRFRISSPARTTARRS